MEDNTEPDAPVDTGGTPKPLNNTGSRLYTETPGPSKSAGAHCCPKCARPYQTRSGMRKHLKDCGTKERTACQFCGKEFTSYQAVRKHESAAHRKQYNEQEEGKVRPSDAEILTKIAEMEANKKSAYFLNDISKATGLTKDQIRHKRTKPEYKEFFRLAKEKIKPKVSISNLLLKAKVNTSSGSPSSQTQNSTLAKTPAGIKCVSDNLAAETSTFSVFATPVGVAPPTTSARTPATSLDQSNCEEFLTPPTSEIERDDSRVDDTEPVSLNNAPSQAAPAGVQTTIEAPAGTINIINIISDVPLQTGTKRQRETEEDDVVLPQVKSIKPNTPAELAQTTTGNYSFHATPHNNYLSVPATAEATSPEAYTPGGSAVTPKAGPEGIKIWLQDYIVDQMSKPPNERDAVGISLAKYSLFQPIHNFQTKITEWIGIKFKISGKGKYAKTSKPNSGSAVGGSNVGSQKSNTNSKHYGQTRTGRGLRAENY